tara:strand:- start:4254 stop:5555 length:1302 start_codon:yes stop_codon:yes gene_type:complete
VEYNFKTKINFMKKNDKMIDWAKDLFSINRSITGKGVRQTLNYLKKINPDIKTLNIKSGKKVYDWILPNEWNIMDGFLEHESGKKFCEFKKNNLNIVNYSVSVDKVLSKKKILPFIHTDKERPNAIPYVTSYYEKNWGFCMPHNDLKKLPEGDYRAYINSTHFKGKLNIGEFYLRGDSKKEIFFSTYICHPSMANNELSGPVLANALINYIKKIKKRKFSYRFVFLPETIGAITYINRNLSKLKKNMFAGYVLSCVGDEREYSIVSSRNGNTLSDHSLEYLLKDKKNYIKYNFLDRGSDERQYCWPSVDLPVCVFCKSKFGNYPEYHTSDDNFKVVTKKGLNQSFNIMTQLINNFENSFYPQSTTICEPFLSKRNLYPTISKKNNNIKIQILLDVLTYCDSKNNEYSISNQLGINVNKIKNIFKILLKNDLIK